MSLTLEQAKALKPGDVLVSNTGARWRVSGMVKTWKSDPSRIYIPLKHGLYSYDKLTDKDFVQGVCSVATLESEALAQAEQARRPAKLKRT